MTKKITFFLLLSFSATNIFCMKKTPKTEVPKARILPKIKAPKTVGQKPSVQWNLVGGVNRCLAPELFACGDNLETCKCPNEREKLLLDAAECGDTDEIVRLLLEGVDINCGNEEWCETPVLRAVRGLQLDTINFLLENGATWPRNEKFWYALLCKEPAKTVRCANNEEKAKINEKIKAIIGYFAKENKGFLKGCLFDEVIDPDDGYGTPLHEAVVCENYDIVKYLVANFVGKSRSDNPKVNKKEFFEFINRKNVKGMSAIKIAQRFHLDEDFSDESKQQFWNIISLLLQNKAKIETPSPHKIKKLSSCDGGPEEEDAEEILRREAWNFLLDQRGNF